MFNTILNISLFHDETDQLLWATWRYDGDETKGGSFT